MLTQYVTIYRHVMSIKYTTLLNNVKKIRDSCLKIVMLDVHVPGTLNRSYSNHFKPISLSPIVNVRLIKIMLFNDIIDYWLSFIDQYRRYMLNNNADIKFSRHGAFLEYFSLGTLKSKDWEAK